MAISSNAAERRRRGSNHIHYREFSYRTVIIRRAWDRGGCLRSAGGTITEEIWLALQPGTSSLVPNGLNEIWASSPCETCERISNPREPQHRQKSRKSSVPPPFRSRTKSSQSRAKYPPANAKQVACAVHDRPCALPPAPATVSPVAPNRQSNPKLCAAQIHPESAAVRSSLRRASAQSRFQARRRAPAPPREVWPHHPENKKCALSKAVS